MQTHTNYNWGKLIITMTRNQNVFCIFTNIYAIFYKNFFRNRPMSTNKIMTTIKTLPTICKSIDKFINVYNKQNGWQYPSWCAPLLVVQYSEKASHQPILTLYFTYNSNNSLTVTMGTFLLINISNIWSKWTHSNAFDASTKSW